MKKTKSTNVSHKTTTPAPSKSPNSPKSTSNRLKTLINWFKLPKPIRYVLKLLLAFLFEAFLIQLASDTLGTMTKSGLASISGTTQADASIAANIINQQLNLATSIFAILIATVTIIFTWVLIIKPSQKSYRKFIVWLNKSST